MKIGKVAYCIRI